MLLPLGGTLAVEVPKEPFKRGYDIPNQYPPYKVYYIWGFLPFNHPKRTSLWLFGKSSGLRWFVWLSRHITPMQLIRRKPKHTLKNMQKLICVDAFGYIHSFLHMPQGGDFSWMEDCSPHQVTSHVHSLFPCVLTGLPKFHIAWQSGLSPKAFPPKMPGLFTWDRM